MSYSYRKLHQSYKDLPSTNVGEDKQPIYRRDTNDAGEPILVVDHYISQQEMIQSDKPEDIRTLVNRYIRGDRFALGDGSQAFYGDVSDLGDINDVADSALAYQVAMASLSDLPKDSVAFETAKDVVESEVKSNES